MIALNVIVLILQIIFPEAAEFFILRHAVINPIAWFSSCIMHAGISHLLGNMVLLAICGWVIEGKVGWWKFILIYFAIGVSANVFEQLIMFWFSESGSLGASGVIFGMIAIMMIWAPENELSLTAIGLLLFYPIFYTFNVSIMGFCFFMIAIEFLTVWFSFFQLSSALLHLMGAMPGAIIGYVMVKGRFVDCEGYDLMSIQSGNAGKRVVTRAQEQQIKIQKQQQKIDAANEHSEGLRKFEAYVNDGHYELALNKFRMLQRKKPSLKMPENQMVAIINGLMANPAKKEKAVPVMELYLQNYDTLRVPIQINLARHALASEKSPRKCMQLIKGLAGENLDPGQLKTAKLLIAKSKQMLSGRTKGADSRSDSWKG